MSDSPIDPDQFTRAGSITKTYYRDVYPAIEPSKPEFSQAGKVSIITGAGSGIGRAITRSHAQSGVKGLVLITLSESSAEETKKIVQAEFPSVEILTLPTDIADEMAVARTFDAIKDKFGTAHTLVNNAGVFAPGAPIVESDSATWWRDFEINVRGTYHVTAAFLRLAAQTQEIKPTVVNLISSLALTPPTLSSYFISKMGVAKLTEFVDAENPHVTAYSLSPGIVLTSMTLDSFKPFAKDTAELTGAVTVYLAAKRPEYLSGRHLSVNWDLEELGTRQSEFASSDKLKIGQFV
ncbi:oxidoreductase short chain dehydrogenase/reductase family [Penicillium frequentans]|uniref:Oxidoreductase short chain dehydrogenase/reductase family n=1 Tax=Penicillium frequentans TaxID=3151616 RepID=A0AAD6GIL8_9EURO|nr:oxidoreductase short chain dehydrogenase/reductase family [Penicillium glabrum]